MIIMIMMIIILLSVEVIVIKSALCAVDCLTIN